MSLSDEERREVTEIIEDNKKFAEDTDTNGDEWNNERTCSYNGGDEEDPCGHETLEKHGHWVDGNWYCLIHPPEYFDSQDGDSE